MGAHQYVRVYFGLRTTKKELEAAGIDPWGDDAGIPTLISVGIYWFDDKPSCYIAYDLSLRKVIDQWDDTSQVDIGHNIMSFDELKKGDEAAMTEVIKNFCDSRGFPYRQPQWFLAWERH